VYALQQRAIGAGRAAPDPLSYLRAIFTPSGSGSLNTNQVGLTRVGAQGEYILAVGVEEQLLPGKTGLGLKGKDVATRKRNVESLIEEGRGAVEDVRDRVGEISEQLEDEGTRVGDHLTDKEREEKRQSGWKSDAFDL